MKENGKLHRFEYWLTNQFWFHYKWYYMAGLFALSLVVCFVVAALTRVHYDWTVVYAHTGAAQPETVASLEEMLSARLPETSGNSRLDVQISEVLLEEDPQALRDERGLYYAADDADIYLVLLDADSYALYHEQLGFFQSPVYDEQTGLYLLLNDRAPTLHTHEEELYEKFTEEELQEVNDEIVDAHNARVSDIRTLLDNWERETNA